VEYIRYVPENQYTIYRSPPGKPGVKLFLLHYSIVIITIMTEKNEYTFRLVVPEDAPQLLEIYAPYVLNTAVSFEYDVPSVKEFRSRIRNTLTAYPYIAAVHRSGRIDGYAYASALKARKAYDHCAELSIYLREECRGKKLGTSLYQLMEEKLKKQGILNLYACIATSPRASDEYLTDASPLFHTHCGFRTIGKFSQCGYKFGLWYDMIWMEKMTGSHINEKILPFSAEEWDIYDVNRLPAGRTMIRGAPDRTGDYHIVVHVCIFDHNGNMLIQQRARDKRGWPGKWDFTLGGHVVAGETSRQGAERELREELGIVLILEDAPYFTINFSDGFDDYYLIQKDIALGTIILQEEEVQNVKYASKDEIKKMIAAGSFIDYHEGLIDLLYAMKQCRGAHTSSGTKEAQKA
jgi:L-amino acid N-acyltransferase YncA/8-oxo-dGTP pyrophosphatase MutT (NUDIX family)